MGGLVGADDGRPDLRTARLRICARGGRARHGRHGACLPSPGWAYSRTCSDHQVVGLHHHHWNRRIGWSRRSHRPNWCRIRFLSGHETGVRRTRASAADALGWSGWNRSDLSSAAGRGPICQRSSLRLDGPGICRRHSLFHLVDHRLRRVFGHLRTRPRLPHAAESGLRAHQRNSVLHLLCLALRHGRLSVRAGLLRTAQ